jgi:hypothetical protein
VIRIIDFETGRDYDLPAGLKISGERVNPFFADSGNISLPIELPGTDNNIDLLGYPGIMQRKNKLKIQKKVIVHAGVFQRISTMSINSTLKSISATLLFDESLLYSAIQNYQMTDIFSKIIRDDFAAEATIEARILKWAEYLNDVYKNVETDDFAVFTVCTEVDEDNLHHGFLNQIRQLDETPINSFSFELAGMQERTYLIKGVEVEIPVGYEITPFLKLKYVLITLFEKLGFELNEDLFTRYPDFAREVVLNNTGDAIMKGYLNYGQLVPNVSVDEYLKSLRYKYGLDFFLQKNGKTVDVVFIKELIESSDDILDLKVNAKPELIFESAKMLKLTCKTSNITGTSKFGSLLELAKNYVPAGYALYHFIKDADINIYTFAVEYLPAFTSPSGVEAACIANEESYLGSVVFYQELYEWYFRDSEGNKTKIDEDIFNLTMSEDGQDDFEKLTYDSPHEFVQMIMLDRSKTKDVDPLITFEYREERIPYVGNARYLNTSIIVNGVTQTNKVVDCPIMSCYPFYFSGLISDDFQRCYGTTYKYSRHGTVVTNSNLIIGGKDGLFEIYWKAFDYILRNSYQQVNLQMSLTMEEYINFTFQYLKLYKYQPIIPESIKYEISQNGFKIVESKFRTSKIYT